MGLGLDPGAQAGQFVAEPDELPELSGSRRSDPCLGQPAQPQQIGQVPSIPLVVLHPAVSPVVALGVGQMDHVAEVSERSTAQYQP